MRKLAGLIAVLLVAGFILGPRVSSMAQAVDPTLFVLAQTDFPAGTQIVDSRVVTNQTLSQQRLQIGPRYEQGRLTGYYMEARRYDASGRLGIVSSFLASIFDSADSAQTAFQKQDDFWTGLIASSPASVRVNGLAAGTVGDPGSQRWYTLTDANGNTHSELFFRRGQYFIEVNLDTFAQQATADDLNATIHMAIALDQLAIQGHRPGPTLTPIPSPTPTSIPTSTPRPTATPRPTNTRVPATAVPSYQTVPEPTKKKKKCKKGYKLVHGKCKKVTKKRKR